LVCKFYVGLFTDGDKKLEYQLPVTERSLMISSAVWIQYNASMLQARAAAPATRH